MLTALELSKYIVTKSNKDGSPINNLQLQIILYEIQKKFLKDDKIAFPDEFIAEKEGPRILSSFYRFGHFGTMPIDLYFDINIKQYYTLEEIQIIDKTIERIRKMPFWDTHAFRDNKKSLWYKIYYGDFYNKIMPQYLIKYDKY